ncbi:hypothetical protein KUCAC02_016493 [Chaenocephalus aceratus]|nr:hypothetical protein KUCAC02_016493 [Chaenocephalus aceratus]
MFVSNYIVTAAPQRLHSGLDEGEEVKSICTAGVSSLTSLYSDQETQGWSSVPYILQSYSRTILEMASPTDLKNLQMVSMFLRWDRRTRLYKIQVVGPLKSKGQDISGEPAILAQALVNNLVKTLFKSRCLLRPPPKDWQFSPHKARLAPKPRPSPPRPLTETEPQAHYGLLDPLTLGADLSVHKPAHQQHETPRRIADLRVPVGMHLRNEQRPDRRVPDRLWEVTVRHTTSNVSVRHVAECLSNTKCLTLEQSLNLLKTLISFPPFAPPSVMRRAPTPLISDIMDFIVSALGSGWNSF